MAGSLCNGLELGYCQSRGEAMRGEKERRHLFVRIWARAGGDGWRNGAAEWGHVVCDVETCDEQGVEVVRYVFDASAIVVTVV
jgi:hypothetical protein